MIKTDRTVLLLLTNQIEQAHFDEIFVLVEITAANKHDRRNGKLVLILVLVEHDNTTLYKSNRNSFRFERRNGGDLNERSEFLVASPFRRNPYFNGTR